MTTGAGFVSFSTFIPLILRNHINFFWRWVTIPPVSSLCILCLSTCEHERFSGRRDVCTGGCRGKREREWEWGEERVRARDTETEREGGSRRIDFHLQQLQFKASQQTSEARQDPACPQPGRAACLRAGLPLGAPGPGTVRRHQKNNYADRGERCARSQTRTTSSVTGKITPCTVSMTWLVIHRSSKMIHWEEINNRNRYPLF